MMIDVEPDLVVVAEAADGVAAVEPAARLRPDVVVMDVRMPRLDGIAATRQIMAQAGPPAVLALTTFDLDEYLFGTLRAGATGFVLKDDSAATLLDGIRAVARGDGFVSPGPTRRLIARRLRIEESTVKTHVQKLLAKLDVRTRVEAALIASRAGLVVNGSAEPGR